ncbi:multi-sensor signal transduction multi-kinase [Nitzschia inconspicua]|uniref:Multi-sensor signal transduction multi-kinase n=1 Tax=Nitzschia inconspicua TaxID=303405 RepID=A0A9K3KT30_9STRA|nr:multi-sensor signal transduction multi-kinase [Nitzschia inconspicua]
MKWQSQFFSEITRASEEGMHQQHQNVTTCFASSSTQVCSSGGDFNKANGGISPYEKLLALSVSGTTETATTESFITRELLHSNTISAHARESIEQLTSLHFNQLQGRHNEIRQLKAAYHRARMGPGSGRGRCPGLVLIHGVSGTGKSMLAKELSKHQSKNCFHGKFDLQKDQNHEASTNTPQEPFSAILDAYEKLCSYLYFNCPTSDQAILRQQLLNAFGDGASLTNKGPGEETDAKYANNVLLTMIPSLQKLLTNGSSRHIMAEMNNEDTSVVSDWAAATEITGPSQRHRLVYLFRSLTQIASNYLKPLVLIIDDLQWADDASLPLLTKLLTDNSIPHFLVIGTYRDDHLTIGARTIVQPWLKQLRTNMDDDATNIEEIQLGNLDTNDVKELVSQVLKIDEHIEDLAQIIHRKTNGNPFFVVQFVTTLRDMGVLNYELGSMRWNICARLQLAFGSTFSDELIHRGSNAILKEFPDQCPIDLPDISISIIGESLTQLLEDGVIERICGSEKAGPVRNFRFAHGQIESTACRMISDENTLKWKGVLGESLVDLNNTEDQQWLYTTADLCNHGRSYILKDDNENERLRHSLIDINHKAGIKALKSSAFTAAVMYLGMSISLLGDNCWVGDDKSRPLSLHMLAAEAAYCSGNFVAMQSYLDSVLKDQPGVSHVSKLPAYITLILSYTAQIKWDDCIKTSLEVLKRLGVKLPTNTSTSNILFELVKTKLLISSRTFDDLCNLPLLDDEVSIYIDRIFDALATATYNKMGPLSSHFSHFVTSKYAFDEAWEPTPQWPLLLMIKRLLLFLGLWEKLDLVDAEARNLYREAKEYQQDNIRGVMASFWQQTMNLMGQTADPLTLDGEALQEGQVILHPSKNPSELPMMYSVKMQLEYLFGGRPEALEKYFCQSKTLSDIAPGSVYAHRHVFYQGAVAFFLAYHQEDKRRKWKKRGLKVKRRIENWLKEGHVNTSHAIPFFKAECCVIDGTRSVAKKHYEDAIRLSSKNGYRQDTALIHERAGINFMEMGDSYWAAHHISSSHNAYLEWGAVAKAKQMVDRYQDLCLNNAAERPNG